MKLFSNVRIWKIIVHIAFKFYSVASETFPTASTRWLMGARFVRVPWSQTVRPN